MAKRKKQGKEKRHKQQSHAIQTLLLVVIVALLMFRRRGIDPPEEIKHVYEKLCCQPENAHLNATDHGVRTPTPVYPFAPLRTNSSTRTHTRPPASKGPELVRSARMWVQGKGVPATGHAVAATLGAVSATALSKMRKVGEWIASPAGEAAGQQNTPPTHPPHPPRPPHHPNPKSGGRVPLHKPGKYYGWSTTTQATHNGRVPSPQSKKFSRWWNTNTTRPGAAKNAGQTQQAHESSSNSKQSKPGFKWSASDILKATALGLASRGVGHGGSRIAKGVALAQAGFHAVQVAGQAIMPAIRRR